MKLYLVILGLILSAQIYMIINPFHGSGFVCLGLGMAFASYTIETRI